MEAPNSSNTEIIGEVFATKYAIPLCPLDPPMLVETIDGRVLLSGPVKAAAQPLRLVIGDHEEAIQFYIASGQVLSSPRVSLLPDLAEFMDVFSEQEADRLLLHRPYDCPIDLVPDAQLPKTGDLRLCCDYRRLNAIMVCNRYPLPLIPTSRVRATKRWMPCPENLIHEPVDLWPWIWNTQRYEEGVEQQRAEVGPASPWTFNNDLLKYWDRLYVPAILSQCHDNPAAEHFGLFKTLNLVSRTFWWPSCATAHMFIQHIFRLHGLPDRVVPDRRAQFTAQFWKGLMEALDVHICLSSVHHPETDGGMEKVIGILEQYLCCFVNQQQNNWVDYLAVVEFAFNNSQHTSTQTMPFLANGGYHPCFFPLTPVNSPVPAVVLELAVGDRMWLSTLRSWATVTFGCSRWRPSSTRWPIA
ncbi:PREDICTED: uncharacterized protein LOC106545800 [Thamnophis sirtalis]|uniref:Gypsy retrotransposon integrase-like protein 1 n=1 Tax=Thamnophis sirtalis TaxID=35019 RepID=A0A6I9XV17_9SAUR|nr:PREDICTED: uncharacterized protein LOC106545800 [Thamnophis sirtalis]